MSFIRKSLFLKVNLSVICGEKSLGQILQLSISLLYLIKLENIMWGDRGSCGATTADGLNDRKYISCVVSICKCFHSLYELSCFNIFFQISTYIFSKFHHFHPTLEMTTFFIVFLSEKCVNIKVGVKGKHICVLSHSHQSDVLLTILPNLNARKSR